MTALGLGSGRQGLHGRPLRYAAFVGTVIAGLGCPSEEPDPEPDETPWAVTHELDQSGGVLLSVWGPSADAVRAVGGQVNAVGEAGVGLMLARDAQAWTPEALPPDTPVLNWIHGTGSTTWAVGNAGAALRNDGSGWVAEETPIDVALWGVFAVSESEAWAVGGDVFDSMGTGVVLHYEGGAWVLADVPTPDRPAPSYFKVWASSATDVHVVGDSGVIFHFDGAAWTQVPSGTTEDLISLWGTGPDEILAVGGRSNGVLARYDGTAWDAGVVAAIPALNGVWMDDDGTAIIAGERNVVARVPAGSDEPELLDTPQRLDVLHAVFGLGDGSAVSVGGSLNNSPPYTGVILERP